MTTGRAGVPATPGGRHVGGSEQQREIGGIDRRGLDADDDLVGGGLRRRHPGQRELQRAVAFDERSQLQAGIVSAVMVVSVFGRGDEASLPRGGAKRDLDDTGGIAMSQNVATASLELNTKTRIPQVGLGVWQAPRGDDGPRGRRRRAAASATGHVDTAAIYGNEADVGRAVRESGIRASEMFVTTKLWNDDQGYDSALKAFDASLAEARPRPRRPLLDPLAGAWQAARVVARARALAHRSEGAGDRRQQLLDTPPRRSCSAARKRRTRRQPDRADAVPSAPGDGGILPRARHRRSRRIARSRTDVRLGIPWWSTSRAI